MSDSSKKLVLNILGNGPAPLDMEKLRDRLDKAKGPTYWKSLEELEQKI